MFEELQIRRERRLGILSAIFTVCAGLSLFPLIIFLVDSKLIAEKLGEVFGAMTPLAAIIIAAVIGYTFFYLSRALKEMKNFSRSERARNQALTDHRPPFVFLRPFAEGPLTSEPARHHGRQGVVIYGHSYAHVIAESVRTHGQVVAIGAPQDVRNFYEESTVMFIQSEEASWREMLMLAISAARAVILIPGTSDGILHEIGVIRDFDLWNKVICFMPPLPNPDRSFKFTERFADEKGAAKEWEIVRIKWRRRGYELPPYDPKGQLFTCTHDFHLNVSASLNFDVRHITTAIEALLPMLPADNKPLSIILPDLLNRESPPCRPPLFNRFFEPG